MTIICLETDTGNMVFVVKEIQARHRIGDEVRIWLKGKSERFSLNFKTRDQAVAAEKSINIALSSPVF